MIKLLKRADRIVLEMHTGILFVGTICQIIGAFVAENQIRYAKSLWFGIAFALVTCVQMGRTLERALADSGNAGKIMTRGYLFRYLFAAVIIAVIAITNVLDTLIVFLGYMSLKVTAYLQPITHKLYNLLFHETDPVPEPMPEDEVSSDEAVCEGNAVRTERSPARTTGAETGAIREQGAVE